MVLEDRAIDLLVLDSRIVAPLVDGYFVFDFLSFLSIRKLIVLSIVRTVMILVSVMIDALFPFVLALKCKTLGKVKSKPKTWKWKFVKMRKCKLRI